MTPGDWEELAKQLLWIKVVESKNEDAFYEISETGELGTFRYSSSLKEKYRTVSWKELALELGLFKDLLTPDGHDCKVCPSREKCTAYFKDDPDHERCSEWEKNYVISRTKGKK